VQQRRGVVAVLRCGAVLAGPQPLQARQVASGQPLDTGVFQHADERTRQRHQAAAVEDRR